MRAFILSLSLLVSVTAYAQSASQPVPVKGTYANKEYGYRVTVPAGLKAERAAAPTPNHGIRIILGADRVIEVNAEFDAPLLGSATAYVDSEVAGEHGAKVARGKASLGGHDAVRAEIDKDNRHETIVATRRDVSGGIFYRLTLDTDAAHLAEDRKLFDKVLSSFRELKPA